MKKRGVGRVLCLCFVLVCMLSLTVSASAAVPARPDNYYVLDSADVISEATEQEIIRRDDELFESTGAEICIAAVDFLGGQDIADYAYDMFNDWGVGSAERNNGLLLVLAVGEDDYYALNGYGLDDFFTGSRLQSMLDDYLEADFAAGNYDAGVKKFFDAAYTELAGYDYDDAYDQQGWNSDSADGYDAYSEPYDYHLSSGSSGGRSVLGTLLRYALRLIVILIIVRVLLALFRSGGNSGGPYNGGGGGGFWRGMFWGSLLGRSRRSGWYGRPYGQAPPPPGYGNRGWGGVSRPGTSRPGTSRPGGFGSGFGGSSRPSGGFSRGGSSFGGSRPSGGGGFSRGGGSRGGGAGRR